MGKGSKSASKELFQENGIHEIQQPSIIRNNWTFVIFYLVAQKTGK